MTRKLGFVVAVVGTVLGLGLRSAYADPVTLDLNRQAIGCTGCPAGTVPMNTVDMKPGNALAVSAIPLSPGVPFQLFFQASLNTFLLNNISVFSPDLQTTGEITAVGGFRETISGGSFPNANTSFVAGGINFFEMYYDNPLDANDLAGTGFNDGTAIPGSPAGHPAGQILAGQVIGAQGGFTVQPGIVPLDNADANTPHDDYPGIMSVNGSGSTRLVIRVDYLNPVVFTNAAAVLAGNLILSLNFDTTNSVPFISVDPSASFWNGTSLFAKNIGTTNGISGPDFQFQTDANGSFETSAVPEPATLTLLGLGLLGSAARRRRKNATK